MTAALILLLELGSLSVVLWHSLCSLNHMNRQTRLAIVAAVVLIFAGAVCRVFLLLAGEAAADVTRAVFVAGIGLGMVANHRRATDCPCVPSFGHHDKEIHT